MSEMPKWVELDMERFPIPGTTYSRLFEALSIAWEALETAEFNYEQDRGGDGICGKAMRRIEELGK